MRKFIIMGIQGSGKGTQAKLLADDFAMEHISVGDVLRWNVQHHTKLGAHVRRTVAGGQLVGDDLVEKVVGDRLAALRMTGISGSSLTGFRAMPGRPSSSSRATTSTE